MASREDDKAMAGLLRRSLARDAGAGKDCPSPEILAAYYDHSLDAKEGAQYELHFSQCARCREQLAAMVRAETKPQPRPQRGWLWDWRWLAPAAAVLVFAIVWVARRPAKPTTATDRMSNAPLVAMSQPAKPPVPVPEAAPQSPPSAATSASAASSSGTGESRKGSALPQESALNGNNAPARAVAPQAKEKVQSVPKYALQKRTTPPKREAALPAGTLADSMAVPAASPAQPAAIEAKRAIAGAAVSSEMAAASQAGRAQAATELEVAPSEKARVPVAVSKYTAATGGAALTLAEGRTAGTVIHSPDPKILWRIAGVGFVERTEDGGATWRGQLPDTNAQLSAGSAPSAKICWLVGRDGMILLTKDGRSWKKISPPAAIDFIAVSSKDAFSATVTAMDGRRFSTEDGGKTWKPTE